MAPHQERVVQERDELKDKVEKLGSFILDNPIYLVLDEEEKELLNEQYFHMCNYFDILEKRIKNFK